MSCTAHLGDPAHEVIQAATRIGAEAAGIGDDLVTLQPGKAGRCDRGPGQSAPGHHPRSCVGRVDPEQAPEAARRREGGDEPGRDAPGRPFQGLAEHERQIDLAIVHRHARDSRLRWSVAPQLERGELVARPLTRGGKYRAWSAAYRSRGTPAHVLSFVELLAKHPLPLGTTARERRRIAVALVDPGPPGADPPV